MTRLAMASLWLTLLLSVADPRWQVPCAPAPDERLLEHATVVTSEQSSGVLLTVSFADAPAPRELVAPDCEAAAKAAVALLQLAHVEPPPSVAVEVPPPAAPPTPLRVSVWLSGGGMLGAAPAITPRAALSLALHPTDAWLIRARVRGGAPAEFAVQSSTYRLYPAVGGDVGLGLGATPGGWWLGGVVTLGAEWIRAWGATITNARSGDAVLATAGLELRIARDVGEHVVVSVSAGPQVALVRPRIELDQTSVFTVPAVLGHAELALGWRW